MSPPPISVTRTRPVLRVVGALPDDADSLEFEAVFRRYSPYVATIGLRLLGRDSELDDLVQDVFIEAHRGLVSVREPGALRGWLARICVRKCLRRLRRRRLRAFLHLDTLEPNLWLATSDASPEQAAEVAAIYRTLGGVAAEARVAWVLRYVEGETLDDIAALCGCSKSTVQRRLRAAERAIEQGAPHG
jgi:RNA polymerase sigma-70 factor (ECF subfamily)